MDARMKMDQSGMDHSKMKMKPETKSSIKIPDKDSSMIEYESIPYETLNDSMEKSMGKVKKMEMKDSMASNARNEYVFQSIITIIEINRKN